MSKRLKKVNLAENEFIWIKNRMTAEVASYEAWAKKNDNSRPHRRTADIETCGVILRKMKILKDPSQAVFIRKEIRVLHTIAKETINNLIMVLIPEYFRRIEEDPAKEGFYQEYIEKSRRLQSTLTDLKLKLEEYL